MRPSWGTDFVRPEGNDRSVLENRVFLTRVAHVSTYTYIGIKGYESSEKEKLTLRSQPQPKLIVRLVISKIERKLIVVSILYLLVVRSCSIRKWELRNPSNIGCEEKVEEKV